MSLDAFLKHQIIPIGRSSNAKMMGMIFMCPFARIKAIYENKEETNEKATSNSSEAMTRFISVYWMHDRSIYKSGRTSRFKQTKIEKTRIHLDRAVEVALLITEHRCVQLRNTCSTPRPLVPAGVILPPPHWAALALDDPDGTIRPPSMQRSTDASHPCLLPLH